MNAGGTMRAIVSGRGVLAGIALLATAGVAACSANLTPSSAGPGNGQTTSPAATAASSTAASAAASTAASATSTGSQVQNLVISDAMRSELAGTYATAYAAGLNVPVSELGVPAAQAGSVYYAYDPATDTYWALGTFEPTAPDSDPAWFQDGTSIGMFKKVGQGPWQVHITLNPVLCGELQFFPQAVLMTWALPTAPPPDLTC
jgi:hypothetical protein